MRDLTPEEIAEFDWQPFDAKFDYWKAFYDVKLPDGRIIKHCWPNADKMNPCHDRSNMTKAELAREDKYLWNGWTRNDKIFVRLSKEHPMGGEQLHPSIGR